MNEVVEFLENCEVQYMATIGLDGKPKVRPFQYMFEDNSKLWFCTGNQKEVYKELQNQPYLELCGSGENMDWLRINAKVVFEDNIEIKAKVFDKSPLVKSIYKNPENPTFEVFYLDEVTAYISEIGKASRTFSF